MGTYTLINQDLYLPALYIVEGEFALAEAFLNEAVRREALDSTRKRAGIGISP